MRRQIRNVLLVITAFLLTVLFCFFPNIQSRLTDWKTFGKSENLSLNPVEISVESTLQNKIILQQQIRKLLCQMLKIF